VSWVSDGWAWYTTNSGHVNPIVAGFGGAALVWAAIRQARTATNRHHEQTRADQQRRLTESCSKAVEQLASDKIEARLGGLYTLERLAIEAVAQSPRRGRPDPVSDLYWTVMETLTAFVRERAKWPTSAEAAAGSESAFPGPATDIAAVIAVIRRRPDVGRAREQQRGWFFDLGATDLSGADLSGSHLDGAKLVRANLILASLSGADLSGAHLLGSKLTDAKLSGANLTDADLSGADLTGADLSGADLSGADLTGADLTDADLSGADLSGAKLNDTKLLGAKLIRTKLSGADLSGAELINTNLIGADLSGAKLNDTKLNDAKLIRTKLSGADLSGAELINTNLIDAKDLTQAQLDKACGAYVKLDPGLTIKPPCVDIAK